MTKIINQERKDFSIAQRESNSEIFNLKDAIELYIGDEVLWDYIEDSLSIGVSQRQIKIDSMSLALDSLNVISETLERGWSYITAEKPSYYNYQDNTGMLRHLLSQILQSRTGILMSITDDYMYKNNIKELPIYKSNDSFKTLVDNIYELGFVICQGEGNYYVEPKSSICRHEHDGVD
ncbi:MAG: hypothetical protein QNL21_09120 [Flavobacteriales bacterium]